MKRIEHASARLPAHERPGRPPEREVSRRAPRRAVGRSARAGRDAPRDRHARSTPVRSPRRARSRAGSRSRDVRRWAIGGADVCRFNEHGRELFRKIQHDIVAAGHRAGLPAPGLGLLIERGKRRRTIQPVARMNEMFLIFSRPPVKGRCCSMAARGCTVHCRSTHSRSLAFTLNTAAGIGGTFQPSPTFFAPSMIRSASAGGRCCS